MTVTQCDNKTRLGANWIRTFVSQPALVTLVTLDHHNGDPVNRGMRT